MNATLTLQELANSARPMGYRPCIINTGGGVMALSLLVDGAAALVALDEGRMSGSEWSVSLDGTTREEIGEDEAAGLPITSDADQTITDAAAWVRATVSGEGITTDGEIVNYAAWGRAGYPCQHCGILGGH